MPPISTVKRWLKAIRLNLSMCDRRIVMRCIPFIALLFSVIAIAPADAAKVEHQFSNCDKLRDSYEFVYGVARDSKAVGMTRARVNARVYAANRTLDKDGDGVACELFVYDSKVTTRSRGFASMYSACKIARRAEFDMGYVLFSDYPYSNEKNQLMIAVMGARDKLPLVRSAAKTNPVFQSAVKAAEQDLKTSTALWQSWPKEPWTPKPDFSFDHWCGYFGVYDSTPGLLPPISWTKPKRSLTVLNGARGVCKQLFWGSPDRVMYSGYDSITLMECDAEASRVARRATDYRGAKDMMLEYVFEWNEVWCWGRDCLTRDDLEW